MMVFSDLRSLLPALETAVLARLLVMLGLLLSNTHLRYQACFEQVKRNGLFSSNFLPGHISS
jgi:hypothetical protein